MRRSEAVSKESPRRITVLALGLRAVPGIAGGVESHCENLYPLMFEAGCDVEVVVRSRNADPASGRTWRGLHVTRLWSPRRSGFEAFAHTFLGVLYAGVRRPDILHLHAIGPAAFTPLAKLLRLRVVVTHHGADYERAKWGGFARWLLKAGERMAMRFADAVISVSRANAARLERQYGRAPWSVPNGVPDAALPASDEALLELGLEPCRYVLHVGRAVPEKCQDDLIMAFARARMTGWTLVLVGDMSEHDGFSTRVRALARETEGVVLAGFRAGEALQGLIRHAGCFVLPSAIEGFSIALLEALSAGCPVLASDIPANREIPLPATCYFPVGDIDAMAQAMQALCGSPRSGVWGTLQAHVRREYDWHRIAQRTLRVYRCCLSGEGWTAVGSDSAEGPVPDITPVRGRTPSPDYADAESDAHRH